MRGQQTAQIERKERAWILESQLIRKFLVAPEHWRTYFPLVKLSVKSDYAARAVLWLAQHHHEGVARKVEEMASAQNIPANYLVQILIELKSKQVVKSQRGKEGGYLLAKPPAEISFGEVLRAIHGNVFDSPALSDSQCPPELRDAWKKMQNALDQTADGINFQKLLDAGAGKEKMYYI